MSVEVWKSQKDIHVASFYVKAEISLRFIISYSNFGLNKYFWKFISAKMQTGHWKTATALLNNNLSSVHLRMRNALYFIVILNRCQNEKVQFFAIWFFGWDCQNLLSKTVRWYNVWVQQHTMKSIIFAANSQCKFLDIFNRYHYMF